MRGAVVLCVAADILVVFASSRLGSSNLLFTICSNVESGGCYAKRLNPWFFCPRRTGLTFLSWHQKVSKKSQGCQKNASSSSQSPSAAGWSSPIRSKLPGLTKWLYWLRLSFFEGLSRMRSIQAFNRPYSFAEILFCRNKERWRRGISITAGGMQWSPWIRVLDETGRGRMSANVFMCDRTGLVQCICVVSMRLGWHFCFFCPRRTGLHFFSWKIIAPFNIAQTSLALFSLTAIIVWHKNEAKKSRKK